MMKKFDYIFGIDPDCEKSGICRFEKLTKRIHVQTLSFPELIDYLLNMTSAFAEKNLKSIVVVEAGWLIESNWHTNRHQSNRVAAAIGNRTGRNHETGRKIIEMCKHYGIDTLEQRPLIKKWSGTDGKITHDEISHFIPGFPSRSNQEVRDAALLAWYIAGNPITIKIQRKKPQL